MWADHFHVWVGVEDTFEFVEVFVAVYVKEEDQAVVFDEFVEWEHCGVVEWELIKAAVTVVQFDSFCSFFVAFLRFFYLEWVVPVCCAEHFKFAWIGFFYFEKF